MSRISNLASVWHLILGTIVAIFFAVAYGVCIQDDAFISFRYAENLIQGNGLVYNAGEKVEGISNLLWTIILAGLMFTGIDPVTCSLGLGYGSIAFFIYSVFHLSRTLRLAVWLPVWLVVLDFSIILEGVQGLESVFYGGLITFAVSLLLTEDDKNTSHVYSTVIFALACLTRPDAPLLFALAHLGMLTKNQTKSQVLKSIVAGCGIALVLAALTGFRLFYYGEYLPNTYYAKVGGLPFSRGLSYLWFHLYFHPLLWLGLFVVTAFWKRVPTVRVGLIICTGYLLYIISIGGDFKFTSRFLFPLVGLMAVFAGIVFYEILRTGRKWIFVVLLLGVYGRWNLYKGANQWANDRRLNFESRKFLGEWLQKNTPPDMVLAIHSAGAIPFYAQRKTIDMWGLNDKVIARTPVDNLGAGLAGHERSNPRYVFSRMPDLYIPEDRFLIPANYCQITEDPECEKGVVRIPVGEDFPERFQDDYNRAHIRLEGNFLNVWVKRSFFVEWREEWLLPKSK